MGSTTRIPFEELLFSQTKSGRLSRLLLFLFFLLPVTILSVMDWVSSYDELTKQEFAKKKSLASLSSSIIHEKLDAMTHLAVSFSSRPELVENVGRGDWNKAIHVLDGMLETFPFVERFLLADMKGVIMADLPFSSAARGVNDADQDWFKEVASKRRSYISGLYESDDEPRHPVINIVVPIMDVMGAAEGQDKSNAELFGILILQLRLEIFSDWVKNIGSSRGEFVAIVDQKGKVVYHPRFSNTGEVKDYSDFPVVQKILSSRSGGVEEIFNPIDKMECLTAYDFVKDYNWGILITQSVHEAYKDRNFLLLTLVIRNSSVILMVFILVLMMRKIFKARRTNENTLRSEKERVEFLLKAFPFPLNIVGENGQRLFTNEKMCLLLGDDGEIFPRQNYLNRVIKTNEVDHIEIKDAFKQRSYLVNRMGLVFQDQNAVLEIFQDITERKKTEEEMQKVMNMKDEFTSMVSHELRTPLGPIKEGSSIILDELVGPVNKEQRELLDIIKRNADRLNRLVTNVLDFQKLQKGRVPFNMQEFDLNRTIEDVYHTMSLMTKNKGLEFHLDLEKDLPKPVYDQDKMIQVLTNLVNNAVKFTEKGYVKVETRKEGNTVHIKIEDTGFGISNEDLPRLFQSFQRLEVTREKKIPGTGLGLAISKEIIQQMNGRIWVESQLGQGTVFHIILPIQERRGRR